MAIDDPVHLNECGLPLNAIEWLETHHRSKIDERGQMIQGLHLRRGCRLLDAGCGPGLWTPLLAQALGPRGHIIGVDVSAEALVTARQRSRNQWYETLVQYKQGSMEHLPVPNGSLDTIFSANVCQYLPQPVQTFGMLGRYLAPGGQLTVKDIDFGTMRFYTIDPALQARVFQARADWERNRLQEGYSFEDSWVGSKLAGYLREAGFENVQEKTYKVVRQGLLTPDFRSYLQGIGRWFICENAPYLTATDCQRWLECFEDGAQCVLDQETFQYEETEFLVTGTWTRQTPLCYFEQQMAILEPEPTSR
jgi:ubiquinone/menaquinone biosynthesis C-methylase UbiE